MVISDPPSPLLSKIRILDTPTPLPPQLANVINGQESVLNGVNLLCRILYWLTWNWVPVHLHPPKLLKEYFSKAPPNKP